MADNWLPFELPDGSYADDTRPFTQQDVVNYLPTFAEAQGTRGPVMYKTAPGMAHFTHVGAGPHRGGRDVEGKLFVVSGRKLYQVAVNGTTTEIGTIPGTGRVSMTHNQIAGGNELIIATGDNSYIYNTVTETLAATGVGLICVDFLNQRILGVDTARRFWRYSGLADANAWDELDNESAESSPDRIIGGIVSQGEWLVFGERTIEVFANAPDETTAFRRTQVIEKGCANANTICRLDNSVMWVGNDGIPYRLNGYTPVPMASKAIIDTISSGNPRKLSAFTWEDKGYVCYYVTAQDGYTFGFDVSSGKWHRRESYGFDRWRVNTMFKWNGAWYAGDFQNGRLYRLQWGYVCEGCEIMPRYWRSGVLHDHGNRVTVHGFKMDVATGGPASEPNCPDAPTYLLVTGSEVSEGSPRFAAALAANPPTFTGIEQGTGADILSVACGHYNNIWMSVEINEARYSTDDRATWQTSTMPFTLYSADLLGGGPDGWLVQNGERVFGQGYAKATPTGNFTAAAYNRVISEVETGPINYLTMIRYTGGYWYIDQDGCLCRSLTLATTDWETVGGYRPDGIVWFHDVVEFEGSLYATVTQFVSGSHYQLRRWNGTDWNDILIDNSGGGAIHPLQLEVGNGKLLVYCWGSQYVYTSADNFAVAHSTGIARDTAVEPVEETVGRQITFAGGYFYIISGGAYTPTPALGNKVVATADGLTFSAPVSTGLSSIASITSNGVA